MDYGVIKYMILLCLLLRQFKFKIKLKYLFIKYTIHIQVTTSSVLKFKLLFESYLLILSENVFSI